MAAAQKRKFVADGVFHAELNELLMRTLAEDGYAGVEVRVTPIRWPRWCRSFSDSRSAVSSSLPNVSGIVQICNFNQQVGWFVFESARWGPA